MSADDQDTIFVYENSTSGEGYKLDINTQPATIVVTRLGDANAAITIDDIVSDDSNDDNDDNESTRSGVKRRKKESNARGVEEEESGDGFEQFHVITGDDENVCMEGSDVEDGEEEREVVTTTANLTNDKGCSSNSNGFVVGNDVDNNSDWTQNLDDFDVTSPFTGTPGLHRLDLDHNNIDGGVEIEMGGDVDGEEKEKLTALCSFRLFLTEWLVSQMTTQTNKYASDLRVVHTDKLDKVGHNWLKDWQDVSVVEMKGFILVLIHMGVVKKPSISDYWSHDVFSASPFASQIMTRNRFMAILNTFHMNDNRSYIPASQSGHDPLHKIRPVYEHLQERFGKVYSPGKMLAIDRPVKCLVALSGGLRSKDYSNSKSNSSSFEIHELSECVSGYVVRFEVHGSETGSSHYNKNNKHSSEIAHRLLEPLLDMGHTVFTDSLYSCTSLYGAVSDRKTRCTGMVSADRGGGMPKDLVEEKLVSGQIAFRRRGKICAVKWNSTERNEKDLMILTSAHHPLITATSENVGKGGNSSSNRAKPICVNDFNKHMRMVVECKEQLETFIPLAQVSTLKWPTRVFLYLLTVCMNQAVIVYNNAQGETNRTKHLSLNQFIRTLGKELTEEFTRERGCQLPKPKSPHIPQALHSNGLARLDQNMFHYMERMPKGTISPKRSVKRACKVCRDVSYRRLIKSTSVKRIRGRESTLWCAVCQIALCVDPCFYLFHMHEDYVTAALDKEGFDKHTWG